MSHIIRPNVSVQKLTVDQDFLKLIHPTRILIAGPSECGKSEWLFKLIKYRNDLFTTEFDQLFYCVPEISQGPNLQIFYSRLKHEFPAVHLIFGLPDLQVLYNTLLPKLVVIDDQISKIASSPDMNDLFTRGSHHHSVSVIYTSQNYFEPTKFGKNLSRNSPIKCFFYDRTDAQLLKTVSQQMFPSNPNFLYKNFQFLNKKFPQEYNYLIIDGDSKSKMRQLFIRSKIFPNEKGGIIQPICFFPAK